MAVLFLASPRGCKGAPPEPETVDTRLSSPAFQEQPGQENYGSRERISRLPWVFATVAPEA